MLRHVKQVKESLSLPLVAQSDGKAIALSSSMSLSFCVDSHDEWEESLSNSRSHQFHQEYQMFPSVSVVFVYWERSLWGYRGERKKSIFDRFSGSWVTDF